MVIDTELFQDGLLLRERAAGFFVRFIGRQPNLVAQRDRIVVQRQQGIVADALPEIAVLVVIAKPHHHAQDAHVNFLIFARRAKSRLSDEVGHVADAVFDVIGSLQVLHFQLPFGSLEFGEQRGKNRIALGRYFLRKHYVLRGRTIRRRETRRWGKQESGKQKNG